MLRPTIVAPSVAMFWGVRWVGPVRLGAWAVHAYGHEVQPRLNLAQEIQPWLRAKRRLVALRSETHGLGADRERYLLGGSDRGCSATAEAATAFGRQATLRGAATGAIDAARAWALMQHGTLQAQGTSPLQLCSA